MFRFSDLAILHAFKSSRAIKVLGKSKAYAMALDSPWPKTWARVC